LAAHPWIGQENIRPKSIAREMYETFQTFSEYVREYQLQRSEGLLLRYLSDVYKTLVKTVPNHFKNDELLAITHFIGSLVKQTDSSLLEQWVKLQGPHSEREMETAEVSDPVKPVFQSKQWVIAIRNEIFRFLRSMSSRDYALALSLLSKSDDWSIERLAAQIELFYTSEHSRICTDTRARDPKNTLILEKEEAAWPNSWPNSWKVQQILVDPEGHNDWVVDFDISLPASSVELKPMLRLLRIGPIEE
jgi:hypothetical protein